MKREGSHFTNPCLHGTPPLPLYSSGMLSKSPSEMWPDSEQGGGGGGGCPTQFEMKNVEIFKCMSAMSSLGH